MLQGVKDLIAEPVGPDGEEKYRHDFVAVASMWAVKVTSDIEKKVRVGKITFVCLLVGVSTILSVFDQMLRVGATNWWIQNNIGNDNLRLSFLVRW